MKTFKIVTNTVPEKCLTVEFPDGKDYFFESGRRSVRIYVASHSSQAPNDAPVFEYRADGFIIKSIITEVSHTPMMEVELENGDILKLSWIDSKEIVVQVRLGSYFLFDPESDYPERGFSPSGRLFVSMDNYVPLNIYGDCIISTSCDVATLDTIDWLFEKYKVKRVQVVPETRPCESMVDRQLDSL